MIPAGAYAILISMVAQTMLKKTDKLQESVILVLIIDRSDKSFSERHSSLRLTYILSLFEQVRMHH